VKGPNDTELKKTRGNSPVAGGSSIETRTLGVELRLTLGLKKGFVARKGRMAVLGKLSFPFRGALKKEVNL